MPGANYTVAGGINSAGQIVGNYGQDGNLDSHGFLYSDGTFTYFDYPREIFTFPTGINDYGLIVGSAGADIGFLYDGSKFTQLRDGTNSATFPRGINNSNVITGGTGTIYTTKAFVMRGGHYRQLNVPGEFVYFYGTGINNAGTVVGWNDESGFWCKAGKCRINNYPGAVQTENLGINDKGIVVGWYDVAGGCLGCAFAFRNGKYLSFRYDGAATIATGISASGQLSVRILTTIEPGMVL